MDFLELSLNVFFQDALAAWMVAATAAMKDIERVVGGGADDPATTAFLYAQMESARLRCALAIDKDASSQ